VKTSRAVILAGGRGERMIPVTEIMPKPLIPINGQPILAHQLWQLERLGITEVIILTGYLASSVERFVENFSTSMKISCIESEPTDSPATRLLKSRTVIGDEFLLIYCDNYILSDTDIVNVLNISKDLTFLIEPRPEGNIEITSNGFATYDYGPRTSKLKNVELGNINIRSKFFFEILQRVEDLPKTLSEFSRKFECSYAVVTGGVWSISNFERFLKLQKKRPVLLLDRDGVLVEKMPKRKYVTSFQEYKPLEANWLGLRELAEKGYDFIIATNQPGVALGEVDPVFLSQLHQRIVSDLLERGINILAIYVCPHHWDENCECRKPRPGMLLQAMSDFHLKSDETLYIGDDDRDLAAAQNAHISGVLIGHDHNEKIVFANLSAAIDAIQSILFQ
jgi:histidinol-phosphate phosphatase family protein